MDMNCPGQIYWPAGQAGDKPEAPMLNVNITLLGTANCFKLSAWTFAGRIFAVGLFVWLVGAIIFQHSLQY